MVEGNRVYTLHYQLFIEDIKHLKEGCVLLYTRNLISLKMTFLPGVFLTPYFQVEIHPILYNFWFLPL